MWVLETRPRYSAGAAETSQLLRHLSRSHFVFLKGHCQLDMVVHALDPNKQEPELREFEANLVKSTRRVSDQP